MRTATHPYRSSDYLDDDEAIAAYAEVVLENDDDAGGLRPAIESVVRAHGLRVLANTTGLPREAIVEALSGQDPDGARTLKAALLATSRLPRREAAE